MAISSTTLYRNATRITGETGEREFEGHIPYLRGLGSRNSRGTYLISGDWGLAFACGEFVPLIPRRDPRRTRFPGGGQCWCGPITHRFGRAQSSYAICSNYGLCPSIYSGSIPPIDHRRSVRWSFFSSWPALTCTKHAQKLGYEVALLRRQLIPS